MVKTIRARGFRWLGIKIVDWLKELPGRRDQQFDDASEIAPTNSPALSRPNQPQPIRVEFL